MIKARYQKMYTEEHKKDMNFVAIGDRYIGPFVDKNRAEMAVGVIEAYLTPKLDEKPKPTKFVKVEESIFDLKEEFERGELYSSDCEGHYTQLKYKKSLYLAAHKDSVYRQVETDWTDELGSFLVKKAFDGAYVNNIAISDLNDNLGSVRFDMELRFNDFIEMCHLVASLTEKPTN